MRRLGLFPDRGLSLTVVSTITIVAVILVYSYSPQKHEEAKTIVETHQSAGEVLAAVR